MKPITRVNAVILFGLNFEKPALAEILEQRERCVDF